MSFDVVMPQMGESIAEGTIVRWIKKVGDSIDKDEPLFEISTDKVDAEIPSPGAGVLTEIKVQEGETVAVNSVVAVIGQAGDAAAPSAAGKAGAATAAAATPEPVTAAAPEAGESVETAETAAGTSVSSGTARASSSTTSSADGDSRSLHSPAETNGAAHLRGDAATAGQAASATAPAAGQTLDDLRRTRSSPVVRKIAKEHGVDISQLNGTGISGRVTKKDILSFVESGAAARGASPAAVARPTPAFTPGENARVEKMGIMRKKIAEHMVTSIRTSAHVYSAYEVDFGRIDEIRAKRKAEYEAAGTKLTYTAFIAKATIDTIRQFPFANASVDGENVVYKRDINLGIAVALDQGLIVPVIGKADERNMLGLCRAIQDLAHRARHKLLKPEEVQGGTFTITNPGIFGALFGLPIISQPQVAILGVGSVDKRVVVVNDMIAIRPMCYLTLGYDHRLIDGADAGRFLQALKDRLQGFEESWM